MRADERECGGDAHSMGMVVEHRSPRRGPLVAGPQTLCADLSETDQPSVAIELYGDPGLGRDGRASGPAPYDREGRRPGRNPAPPFR